VRAGSAGRGEEGGKKEEGRGAFAQGTDRCVYVPLQDTNNKRSALHYASSSGLESTVAKLLSLGADAALIDAVRAYCSYTNTCMYISPYVFIRIKGSCSSLYPSLHLCIYMHSAHAHTRKVAFMFAYIQTCTYTDLMSERELRHEYPYPSEVFMCGGYSRYMYLNVIQITYI
jgi:hypothetical protein